MLKTIIAGIAVGVANIIPGVSGGTMMVVLGVFHRMTAAISGIFKLHNEHRKDDILFMVQLLGGAVIGLVGFAKILNFLFAHYPTQTMYWFIGLIVFSIPLFLKDELKGEKVHPLWFVVGLAIIFGLEFLNPGKVDNLNPAFPAVTAGLLVRMVFVGMIAGSTMIMPGVSGSMVLLIIGEYYLFKSYLASVTSFSLDVLIPLVFMACGIGLGIILSAKFCKYALEKFHRPFLSVILGLIVASSVVLIPFDAAYNGMTIVTSVGAFVLGCAIVYGLSKVE